MLTKKLGKKKLENQRLENQKPGNRSEKGKGRGKYGRLGRHSKMRNFRICVICCVCILGLGGCSLPWQQSVGEGLTLVDESTGTASDRSDSGETVSIADSSKADGDGTVADTDADGTYANAGSADGSGSICVYICGQVEREGVYMMDADCRVYQVIAKAGGLKSKADISGINQAARVQDGEKIYIPKEGEEISADANGSVAAADAQESTEKVNINTADKNELMTLNGIGESRAESIIHYREKNGAFAKPEDLKNVSGIGDGIFGKIEEDICV